MTPTHTTNTNGYGFIDHPHADKINNRVAATVRFMTWDAARQRCLTYVVREDSQ